MRILLEKPKRKCMSQNGRTAPCRSQILAQIWGQSIFDHAYIISKGKDRGCSASGAAHLYTYSTPFPLETHEITLHQKLVSGRENQEKAN